MSMRRTFASEALRRVDALIAACHAREVTGSWTPNGAGDLWAFNALAEAEDILAGRAGSRAAADAIDDLDAAIAADTRQRRARERDARQPVTAQRAHPGKDDDGEYFERSYQGARVIGIR
jgi:hypothetical protein